MLDYGLLLLRVVVGLIVAGHGAQKLFGAFGGHGHAGTRDMMRHIGVSPAGFWAWMAGLSEFGGGALLALGLLNPLGTLGITAAMVMAIAEVHWPKGLWNTQGGFELPLTYLVVAIAIVLTGPGAFALDSLMGIALPEPISLISRLAGRGSGVVGGSRRAALQSDASGAGALAAELTPRAC